MVWASEYFKKGCEDEDPLGEALQKRGNTTNLASKTIGLFVRTVSFVFRSSAEDLRWSFLTPPVVESDFFVVKYAKSANRRFLSDIYLDGILHAKQFELAQRLSQTPCPLTRILR
jgi:hypothetical protein